MRFVGIDLAWSPRHLSGGAVLDADGQVLQASGALGDDAQILRFVTHWVPAHEPGLIAIDAPLAVPNETGIRACDRELASVFARFQAVPYPANRQRLRPYGGLRGESIRQELVALGFRHDPEIEPRAHTRQVIEVFPHPAVVSLLHLERTLKYKARAGRDWALRWRELARLREGLASLEGADPSLRLPAELAGLPIEGLTGRAFKEVEDCLDAIVCAYTALWAWHHGPRGCAVYGLHPKAVGNAGDQGHILVPMTSGMWQRIKGRRLLLLDRDGTLNRSLGGRPPNSPREVELLPGVHCQLRRYAALGWRLVVITNQGGVAFGYQSEAAAWAVHQAMLDALPVQIEASYLCPHHPEGTRSRYAVACPFRKPEPGAIFDALRRFQAEPRDCLFVGDLETDRLAAEAAGVPFCWADEFFGRSG